MNIIMSYNGRRGHTIPEYTNRKGTIMKYALVTVLLAASVLLVSCSSGDDRSSSDTVKSDTATEQLYTCSMHPEIIRKEPGDCPVCGMHLTPVKQSTLETGSPTPDGERKVLYYKDPMHPWYTSDHPGTAPDCGMDLVPVYEGQEGSAGVVHIDPAVVQNINVKIEPAGRKTLNTTIQTSGHIGVAEPGLAIINTKINGWVDRLFVDFVGQSVGKGEKLMDIYSPQLVAAQEELLTAIDYNENVSKSTIPDVVNSGTRLIENARRKLELWDISDDQIDELIRTRKVRRTLTIFAPSNGVVLEKNVIQGQHLAAGQSLLKIADLSTVWLHADLYEHELALARTGQRASMRLPYIPGKLFEGRVAFIYPTLDPKARTGKVRIDFPNPDRDLKPEMFANVEIETQPRENVVAVPEQAVIRTGTKNIIIVSLGDGRFEPREIELGIYSSGYYEVTRNLRAGERVVVSSQFLIDSESNLRAALSAMRSGEVGTAVEDSGMEEGESRTPSESPQR